MPTGSSQKGTGKKGAAAMQKQSRTSTPAPAPTASLPPQEAYDPDYLNTRVILFKAPIGFEDLVDQSALSSSVPDSRSIDTMMQNLKDLMDVMEKRSNFYDRGMRFLADERKNRPDDYAPEPDQEEKRPKHKRKKASDSLAPPDGSQGTFKRGRIYLDWERHVDPGDLSEIHASGLFRFNGSVLTMANALQHARHRIQKEDIRATMTLPAHPCLR